MVSFKTAITNTDKEKTTYEITFTTDNKEYYEKVQEECRRCIDLSSKTISKEEDESEAEKLFKDLGYGTRRKQGKDILYIKGCDDTIIYFDNFNKTVTKLSYNHFDGARDYCADMTEAEQEAVRKQEEELQWWE